MPFIDDDLLWCSDNDTKLIDLSCLDGSSNGVSSSIGIGGGGLESNSESCSSSSPVNGHSVNMAAPSSSLNSFTLSYNNHHLHQQQQSRHNPNNNSHNHNGNTSPSVSTTTPPTTNSNGTTTNYNNAYHLNLLQSDHGHQRQQQTSTNSHMQQHQNGQQQQHHMQNPHGQHGNINGTSNDMDLPTLSQLSQADLNGLVSTLDDDDDDLFKQLGETSFELDAILDVFVDENHHPPSGPQASGGTSGPPMHPFGGHTLPTYHAQQHNSMQSQQQQAMIQHQQQLQQNYHMNGGPPGHSGMDDRGGVKRRKRIVGIKCPPDPLAINVEGACGNINIGQRKLSNNGQGPLGSILQSQLCNPNQPDGHRLSHPQQRGKPTIAANNPLLAGKLAAGRTEALGQVGPNATTSMRHNMINLVNIKIEPGLGSPENGVSGKGECEYTIQFIHP